jgi:hypothetical protein
MSNNSNRWLTLVAATGVVLLGLGAHGEAVKQGTSIDPDKIPVAKDGKGEKNFEDIDKSKKAEKPRALSRKDKEATVRRVRALAGVEKKDLEPVPPAIITLSADAIRQGKSWIGMLKGAIRPGNTENDPAYMTIGPKEGVFLLHFEPLASGSPYILDCEVSAFPKGNKIIWEVHGAFNGMVEDQKGHLLIGFIPSDKVAKLSISRHKGLILGHLFKCELTRVD